jgi:hypothetical protein
MGRTALPVTALNTTKASFILHGSGCHPTIWRVKLAHYGAAEMAPQE